MIRPDDETLNFVIGGPQRGPDFHMGASSTKEQAVSDPAREAFQAWLYEGGRQVNRLAEVESMVHAAGLTWQARDAEIVELRDFLEGAVKSMNEAEAREDALQAAVTVLVDRYEYDTEECTIRHGGTPCPRCAVIVSARAALAARATTVRASVPNCPWSEDEDGNWDTGCGEKYTFIDGGPNDNGMKFCCYCGLTLLQPDGGQG